MDIPQAVPGQTVDPPTSPFSEVDANVGGPRGGSRSEAPEPADVADAIATAALAVPGVTRLHSGSFGEVATYLPGRRVSGVKTTDTVTEVHVVLDATTSVIGAAEAVRGAIAPLVDTPVDVYVEDLDQPSPS